MSDTKEKKVLSLKLKGSDDNTARIEERLHKVLAQAGLGSRRALEERNVLPSKLKSHGYGETKPICKEHNETCWSKNRRVEFIIEKTGSQGGAKFQGGEGQ